MKIIKKAIKSIFRLFGLKVTRIKKAPKSSLQQCDTIYKNSDKRNDSKEYQRLPFAGEAIQKLINDYDFNTVLDIGSGEGLHSKKFIEKGKKVTSIDFGTSVYFEKKEDNYTYIKSDYYEFVFDEKFDAIWASHVLEHQPNPNLFLKKIHKDLKDNGVLAITVPPLKHEIVGGHVSLWNAGLLMYQLVLAGFNCRDISIKSYGYNISAILKKKSITAYPELSYDSGDILKLKEFFPEGIAEPFDGRIRELNWLKNE